MSEPRPEPETGTAPATPDRLSWYGWTERPATGRGSRHRLPRPVRSLLADECGLSGRSTPPVGLDEVTLRPPALPPEAATDLAKAVGLDHVRTDQESRLRHAGGKSYLDLLRRRRGDAEQAPDAVVLPGTHDEVLEVLRCCVRHRIGVVPFGGGTSVVGGVEPVRGILPAVIALDLSRLTRVTEVDVESLTVRAEPGLTGPALERVLAGHGLTLGHAPQSYAHATLGGYAATRSSGQASSGYGRFDDMVLGLRVATPEGAVAPGRAPASAAGPDLRAVFLGSEGTLGVITELTLRVRPRPEARRYEAWSFRSVEAGVRAVRRLAQGGGSAVLPDVVRLSDPEETRINLALAGRSGSMARRYLSLRGHRAGCLLVLGWEDAARRVRSRRLEAVRILRAEDGVVLGRRPGPAWERGRFHGPALRDDLLDAGALVETLETATSWSRLGELHAAVAGALRAALPRAVVMAHVSHVYPAGASLYFTVIAARDTGGAAAEDEQWRAAKDAAGAAIVAGGATITHHHAVGLDHRPWMAAEMGDLGLDMLRAVKARLDPVGILNPGKLLP